VSELGLVNCGVARNFQNRMKMALRFSLWTTLLLMMTQGAFFVSAVKSVERVKGIEPSYRAVRLKARVGFQPTPHYKKMNRNAKIKVGSL